jgi:hypothetical protein
MSRPIRRRRTHDEIDRLLRDYDSSGLSQAKFAQRNRVALTTLQWWLKRRREQRGNGSRAPALIPVTVRPGTGAVLIEVALVNGRELRVPIDTDPARLAMLVAALDT